MRRTCLLLILIVCLGAGCAKDQTDDLYLIPEGYTGYVLAIYDVEGAAKLTYEDGYAVHEINKDGYFATSHSDLDYGLVTDQYFYIDEHGNRTRINDQCIRGIGTGGMEKIIENGETIDLNYTGVEIASQCTADFPHSANGMDSDLTSPIINKVMQEYYGAGVNRENPMP